MSKTVTTKRRTTTKTSSSSSSIPANPIRHRHVYEIEPSGVHRNIYTNQRNLPSLESLRPHPPSENFHQSPLPSETDSDYAKRLHQTMNVNYKLRAHPKATDLNIYQSATPALTHNTLLVSNLTYPSTEPCAAFKPNAFGVCTVCLGTKIDHDQMK